MRPFRRQPGQKPVYSLDQTKHYVSQYARYQRRVSPSSIQTQSRSEVADSCNRSTATTYLHLYPSSRSPSGSWRTTVTEQENCYNQSCGSDGGGGGSGSDPCAWTPETPTSGTGCVIEIRTWTGWWAYADALGEGYYADADANYNPIYHAGLEPTSSQTITTANDNYLLSGGSDQNRAWNLTVSYRLASPVQSDEWGNQLYYLVYNWRCAYVYDNYPFIGYGVWPAPEPRWPDGPDAAVYGIAVHACGGNTASTDSGCPYPPPMNTGGGGGGSSAPNWTCTKSYSYSCDCPDYTQQQKPFLSRYPSTLRQHTWFDSAAQGARELPPYNCKHIFASARIVGDPFPAPDDQLPMRRPPRPERHRVPDWLRRDRAELRRFQRQWRNADRARDRARRRANRQEREADLSY